MSNQFLSPETGSTGAAAPGPLANLAAQYQAAYEALDQAHIHRGEVTPPWPCMSPDELNDEVIERVTAEHRKVPEYAAAEAQMERWSQASDTIAAQIAATPACTPQDLAIKAKLARELQEDHAEMILESLVRDTEALAA